MAGGSSQDMREHIRPFTADVGRRLHVHDPGKLPIESQATGNTSCREMVAGGAVVWGSSENQSARRRRISAKATNGAKEHRELGVANGEQTANWRRGSVNGPPLQGSIQNKCDGTRRNSSSDSAAAAAATTVDTATAALLLKQLLYSEWGGCWNLRRCV